MGVKKALDEARMANDANAKILELNKCPACSHVFSFLNKAQFKLSLNPKCPNCKKHLKELILEQFSSHNKKTETKIKDTLLIGISEEKVHQLSSLTKGISDKEKILAIVFGNANVSKNLAFTMDLSSVFGKGDFLIVTSDRVFIIKGGMNKVLSGSLGEQKKSYYYADITSIDISSNLGRYRLEITHPGQTTKQAGLFAGNIVNENSFEYTKYIKEEMEDVFDIINEKIRAVKTVR